VLQRGDAETLNCHLKTVLFGCVLQLLQFLGGRPNRPRYMSCLSVCLPVRLSVPYGILTGKQKGLQNVKIGVNFPSGQEQREAIFSLKGQRSDVGVRDAQLQPDSRVILICVLVL